FVMSTKNFVDVLPLCNEREQPAQRFASCALAAFWRNSVRRNRVMLPTARRFVIKQKKDWVNIAFLTLTPVVAVAGTVAWTWLHGFHLWMPLLTIALYLAVGFSICAGYHRFFSHKSYEASRPLQVFYAIFGAMA